MASQTFADLEIAIGKKVDAVSAKIDTLIASGVKVDLTAVLAGETGIQDTVNSILQQVLPTPPVPDQTPIVTGISPTSATTAGGETITVTGTNFTGATGVMVGTVAATGLVIVSDTSLTFVNPAQPAGALNVSVVDAAGSSANSASDILTIA